MSFFEPCEASKEANLSFPTYCCLLGEETRAGGETGQRGASAEGARGARPDE